MTTHPIKSRIDLRDSLDQMDEWIKLLKARRKVVEKLHNRVVHRGDEAVGLSRDGDPDDAVWFDEDDLRDIIEAAANDPVDDGLSQTFEDLRQQLFTDEDFTDRLQDELEEAIDRARRSTNDIVPLALQPQRLPDGTDGDYRHGPTITCQGD